MKKNGIIIVLCAVLLNIVTCEASAKTVNQTPQQVDQWLGQLESRDWQIRQEAALGLSRLPSGQKTDVVKKAFINELEKEFNNVNNEEFEQCTDCDDGGEEGYYSWLFETVAAMKDERAFSLFVRIGSPTALVNYGNKGIEVIIEKINYDNFGDLAAVITVLGETLNPKKAGYIAKGEIKRKIKHVMIHALEKSKHHGKHTEDSEIGEEEQAIIREKVVVVLGYLAESGDREALHILKKLAEEDDYSVDRREKHNHEVRRMVYPIREKANWILKNLNRK